MGISDYLYPKLAWVWPLGFSKPPGGEIGSKHHVLNDHTYCCQVNGVCAPPTNEPQQSTADMCEDWHNKRLKVRKNDANKLQIPLAISEFGACMGSQDCVREIT